MHKRMGLKCNFLTIYFFFNIFYYHKIIFIYEGKKCKTIATLINKKQKRCYWMRLFLLYFLHHNTVYF